MTAAPAAPPPAARAAAALGLAGGLPLLLVGAGLAAATDGAGAAGPLSELLLLLPVPQLTGAVLLLRRRSWRVLAAGCLPGGLLLTGHLAAAGPGAVAAPGAAVALALPAVTLVLTVRREVRTWVAERPGS